MKTAIIAVAIVLLCATAFSGQRCEERTVEIIHNEPRDHRDIRVHVYSLEEKTREIDGEPVMKEIRRRPPRIEIRILEEVTKEPKCIEQKCVDLE